MATVGDCLTPVGVILFIYLVRICSNSAQKGREGAGQKQKWHRKQRGKSTIYVLVHGSCRGAWCWYILKPRLQSAGHRVSVLDLAASAIHPSKIQDLRSLPDYSQPLLKLLASLPPDDKAVLVGHSYAGVNLALSLDLFPHKVALAVFLIAFLPDTPHRPSHVLEKDVELVEALMWPASYFADDLSKANNFSQEGDGFVPRVFITCNEDLANPMEFLQWMVQNAGAHKIMELRDADHMAMLSKPQELCDALLQAASKYA